MFVLGKNYAKVLDAAIGLWLWVKIQVRGKVFANTDWWSKAMILALILLRQF